MPRLNDEERKLRKRECATCGKILPFKYFNTKADCYPSLVCEKL